MKRISNQRVQTALGTAYHMSRRGMDGRLFTIVEIVDPRLHRSAQATAIRKARAKLVATVRRANREAVARGAAADAHWAVCQMVQPITTPTQFAGL